MPVGKFQFTGGEPSTHTRQGSSGKPVHYKFCANCATTLCAEITAGNFYSVGAATLNDNNAFMPKMGILQRQPRNGRFSHKTYLIMNTFPKVRTVEAYLRSGLILIKW